MRRQKAILIMLCTFLAAGLSSGCANILPHQEKPQTCASLGTLEFTKARLKGCLAPKSQIHAGEDIDFEMSFWDPAKGSSQGPFLIPDKIVAMKLIMACCGSTSKIAFSKNSSGAWNFITNFFASARWNVSIEIEHQGVQDESSVEIHVTN